MALLTRISESFWSEDFWLPGNTTWADLEKDDGLTYPKFSDLYRPLFLSIIVFFMRFAFERWIATPLGRCLGIREGQSRPPPDNPILERQFQRSKSNKPLDKQILTDLGKQTDLSAREIERWFRMRRNAERPSPMVKFTESTWRFTYYVSIFIYGVAFLWQKPWFWDSTYCWRGYPRQDLTPDLYWYYMISLSFYWSLLFSQFVDIKRKDFWQMFIHHLATICLMCFSYTNNMVRIGSLVLVVHDAVDYWMEAAKMAKYASLQKLCDALFVVFTVVWFVTRLVLYPMKVMVPALFEPVAFLGLFGGHRPMCVLLVVLQMLHGIWFCMIVRIAWTALKKGKVDKDDRSESEEDDAPLDEDDDEHTSGESATRPRQRNGTRAK